MAEVIGTVSACIAVAETGLKVAKAIRERVHRSQTVRQEVSRIAVTLDTYQILFEALRAEAEAEAFENDNVDSQSRLTALCAADGPLEACSEALTALEKRLSHVSGSVSLGKIIDSRTSAALSCLQEARPVLELALASDQRTIAKNVHNALGTLQSYVHEMRSETRNLFKTTARMSIMVQAMMRKEDAGNRKTMLNDIFAGNVVDRWRSNVSGIKADSNTCSWFFDSKAWEEWTQRSSGIMWLTGPSGVGKTVLLSLAISRLQMLPKEGDRNILCAYFFFDFNMSDMQRPDYMARSLIHQLVSGPASSHLDRIYGKYFSGDSGPAFIQCRHILQEIVDDLHSHFKIFFVIDALDEATDLADVFKYLPTLQHCQVMLSSQEVLCRQYSIASARMVAMNLEEITPDIESYVELRLANDSSLHRLSDDRKKLIQKGIMEKSQGMFRLAQCQLDYIGRLSDKRVVRLREVLQKLPNALNGIYQNHIDRIFDEDGRQLVLRLLFLLSRFRTLRVAEVAEYLAFTSSGQKPGPDDLFDEDEVIELGGRFIRVSHLPDGTVRLSLAHTTVATFLKDTYSDAETSTQVSAYCEQYFHLPVDLEQLRQSILKGADEQGIEPVFPRDVFSRHSHSIWKYLDAAFPLHRLCSRALRKDRASTAPRLTLRVTDGDPPPLWYICYLATFMSAETPGECLKYLLCFLPKASTDRMQRWTQGTLRHAYALLDTLGNTLGGKPPLLRSVNDGPMVAQRDPSQWPSEADLSQALGPDWRVIAFHTRAYTLLVCYVEGVVHFVGRGDQMAARWGEAPSSLQHTFTTAVRPGNDFSSKLRLTMLRRKLAQGLRQMLKDLKAVVVDSSGVGGDAGGPDTVAHEEAVCEHILKWAGRGQGKFEWPDVTKAAA